MKQFTEKAKKAIEELEDPFMCIECQKLGYCKERRQNMLSVNVNTWAKRPEAPMNDSTIANLVPLNAKDEKGRYSREHLTVAYDAFHQKDYETAELHFRAVLEVNARSTNANIGLAATCYFLKKFDEAIRFMAYYESDAVVYRNIPNDFVAHCEKIMMEQKRNKSQHEYQEPEMTKVLVQDVGSGKNMEKVTL